MPDRLQLAEIQDLAKDPRMQNPQIRAQVFAKLDPGDVDAVTNWLAKGDEKPFNLTRTITDAGKSAVGYAKDHPIETGAALGGLAAGAATGGAGLLPELAAVFGGGAAGSGYGQLANLLMGGPEAGPTTAKEGAALAAKEGGGQVLADLTGRGIGAGLRGTGNLLMNEVVPQGVAKDFPGINIGAVLNREGINPMTRSGAAKATALRGDAASQTQALVDQAVAKGAPGITRRDVAVYLAPAEKKAAAELKAGEPGGVTAIQARVDKLFDPQFPFGDLPLKDAPDVVRELQDEGKIARKLVGEGKRPTDLASVTANNLATGIRRATADRVPGYEAANARTQELIAAARAAEKGSKTPIKLGGWPSRVTSGGIAGAGALSGDPITLALSAVPLAAGTPQVSAPIALNLYRAGKLPYNDLLQLVGPEALKQAGFTEQK